jgi:hypothetical protein
MMKWYRQSNVTSRLGGAPSHFFLSSSSHCQRPISQIITTRITRATSAFASVVTLATESLRQNIDNVMMMMMMMMMMMIYNNNNIS